jgi:hypothetical protein
VTNPQGSPEDYWIRTFLSTGGSTGAIWYFEHVHDLAVADVVFEGQTARVFTWPTAWNKFQCVRFHNLDPNPTPLVVTFEETGQAFNLNPWDCLAYRRNPTGPTWERQGFLLFRARGSDIARFGNTMPWNDKVRANPEANPWQILADADAANNVASFAAVFWALECFTPTGTPWEMRDSLPGGGLSDAYDQRTGIWLKRSEMMPAPPSCPPLGDAENPETPVWRLRHHGGEAIICRSKDGVFTNTAVNLDLDAMQEAGGDPLSGLKLTVRSNDLLLEDMKTPVPDFTDVICLSCSLRAGPIYVPPGGTSVDDGVVLPKPVLYRVASSTVEETAYGRGTTVNQDHVFLGPEGSTPGGEFWQAFGDTAIADVDAYGPVENTWSAFPLDETRWDGRRLAKLLAVDFQTRTGNGSPGSSLADLWASHSVSVEETKAHWFQIGEVQVVPPIGGVWFLPERRRRKWEAAVDDIVFQPMILAARGQPTGADWAAKPTTQAPLSGIARFESPPIPTRPTFGVPLYISEDMLDLLKVKALDPAWWAAHRTEIYAGTRPAGEKVPNLGVGLMSEHFNILAARLNAISEVVPFSFFDAQWYGTPFRPASVGIEDGPLFPGDYCATAELGSETNDRAADLGITVRTFATRYPEIVSWEDTAVESTTGTVAAPVVYTAFLSHNLLNDLCLYWRPDRELSQSNIAVVIPEVSSMPPPWFQGNLVSGNPALRWWGINNAEAVLPDFRWVTIGDVQVKAASLGIPFRFFRLARGHKFIKVRPPLRTANLIGWGGLGNRTQIAMVPDSSSTPDFIMIAGVTSWFAPSGVFRVAAWRPMPEPVFVDEASEWLGQLDQGVARTNDVQTDTLPFDRRVRTTFSQFGDNSTHQNSDWLTENWWQNGSAYWEAPRLHLFRADTTGAPPGWTLPAHRLGIFPTPACQWGATDIEAHSAKPLNGTWADIASLGTTADPSALYSLLGGTGWDGNGGFVVMLWPAGVKPG